MSTVSPSSSVARPVRFDRAVRFARTGGPEVLEVEPVPEVLPAPGEVRVRVVAAGLNPVDWKILRGGSGYPLRLPSGNGNDLAGVVDVTGEGVHGIAVGDRVCGGSRFHAQADHVILPAENAVPVPDDVPLSVAATLDIVGRTATAALDAVRVVSGDTVLVSGAAGGLGSLVMQLALHRGARVVGTGSASSAERIRGLGALPVEYGDGLEGRIRDAAPGGVDAVLDCAGHGTVETAIALGIDPDRINTNADRAAVERWGVRNEGGHTALSPAPLAGILDLIAHGALDIRIAARYPLERVREAYEELMRDHTQGKIVLVLDPELAG